MSYAANTDFLALLRQTSGGVRTERMPGLDYVVAALARAGIINVSVSQTAPLANQATTAWFRPALPTWSAEGVLYLWNAVNVEYEAATPALWAAYLTGVSNYAFQSGTSPSNTVNPGVSLFAVQRSAPSATSVLLPNLVAQWTSGRKLQIVDFSTSVTLHDITLTTPDGSTIMRLASWRLRSTADSLTGVMLQPSPDLNSWIIAP